MKRLLALFLFAAVTLIGGRAVATHIAPNWVPTSIETAYTGVCPGGPGLSGYTVNGVFPNPSTITTPGNSGTTNVYAASMLCPWAPYDTVTDVEIEITSIVPVGTTATLTVAGGSLYSLGTLSRSGGTLPLPARFTDPQSKIGTMTGLKEGSNCWQINFIASGKFGGNTDISQPGTWGICVTYIAPKNWNYALSLTSTAAGTYKPGTSLSLGDTVTNIGTGTGRSYDNKILITSGVSALTPSSEPSWLGESGLASGSARVRTAPRIIKTSAADGTKICHRGWISASKGQSTPTSSTTPNSERQTLLRCYTVYSKRYGIATPTVVASKKYVLPGDSLTVTYSVCNSSTPRAQFGYSGATHRTTPSAGPGKIVPYINYGKGAFVGTAPASGNMAPTAKNGCVTRSAVYSIPTTAAPGDTFCADVKVTRIRGWSDGSSGDGVDQANNCAEPVKVVAAPYLRATGSDVIAGSVFSSASTPTSPSECSSITPSAASRNAILKSQTSVDGTKIVGGTTDYGGFATGKIRGWGTGGGWLRYGRPGYSLSFRNADASQANLAATTNQRGFFRSEPLCSTNLYSYLEKTANGTTVLTAPTTGGVLNAGALVSGKQYSRSGDLTINGFDLGARRVTIVVDGDVTIKGNVFANYAVGSTREIPLLMVVANGQILIENEVTRLDGIYAAVSNQAGPTTSPRGQIETCRVTNRSRWARGSCANKLTVNGMLVARRINFWRSSDTISGATVGNEAGRAAEVVRFSPELYLGRLVMVPDVPKSVTGDIGELDQFKDLPPVR